MCLYKLISSGENDRIEQTVVCRTGGYGGILSDEAEWMVVGENDGDNFLHENGMSSKRVVTVQVGT